MSTERLTNAIMRAVLQSLQGGAHYGLEELQVATDAFLSKGATAALRTKGTFDEIRRVVYYMKRVGYLERHGNSYFISNKGLVKLFDLQFEPLDQTEAWDKKWRLILFDIPEKNRRTRDTVRRLIERLGFVQLQRSVWMHPLPCQEVFERIRDAYQLQGRMSLLEVSRFDQEVRFYNMFKKKYPNL